MAKTNASDRSIWKMNPEQLQAHLQLQRRARRIPDKKKQLNKKACRGKRQAFGLADVDKFRRVLCSENQARHSLSSYAFGYEHNLHGARGRSAERQEDR